MYTSTSIVLSLASLLLVNAAPPTFGGGQDCHALGGLIVPAFNGPWGGFGAFPMCYVPKTATNYGSQCITSSGQHYYWQDGPECNCLTGCDPKFVGPAFASTSCNLTSQAPQDCLVSATISIQLNDTLTFTSFGLNSVDNTIALTSISTTVFNHFQLGYDQILRTVDLSCVSFVPFGQLSVLAVGTCNTVSPTFFSIATLPSGLQTLIYVDASNTKNCFVQKQGRIVGEDCNSGHPSILAYLG